MYGDTSGQYKVLDTYISIMEKHAVNDKDGLKDAELVLDLVEKYPYDIMDEKLAIRFINLMKRISYQKCDEINVKSHISHLLENDNIVKAFNEYREAIKDLPDVVK